jgi:Protein kinase domain
VNALSVGDVIAGYRLEALVGRGGMGVVYRATHVALERRGAVKVIAPELAANEEFRRRFQRESKLAASIDHPHVTPVFDAGEEAGHLYVAMRFVEGTDLGALLAAEGPLAPGQAVEVIGQVASALDAAHARGLVHRDVKPANVLLERRGSGYHAYLTDFGLVKAMGAASGVLTRTGQWLGTPDFVAPEQIMGSGVDARTDVYSLGCVLFQVIAGKPPFERDTEVAKIYAHLQEPPPSLSAVRPDVPAKLDDVIGTALAKSPDDRYPSAGVFAAAAELALEPGTPTVPAPAERETAARPTRAAPKAPSPARSRRRWLVPAIGVAAVAAVAAVALALSGGGGGDNGGSSGGGGGGGGATAAAVIPDGNLTSNPSFESDTAGWTPDQADIAREEASDAPDGDHVVRVSLTGSGDYSIDDTPDTVSSSVAGRDYTARAWIKGTDSTDGDKICISIRERPQEEDAGDFPHSESSLTATAGEYQQVQVTHRAAKSGMRIDVHVFQLGDGASEGDAFLADAITLTEGDTAGGAEQSC